MPVYEYEHMVTGVNFNCSKGKEFEEQQSIKDDALTACPECQLPVKRLISKTNFSWKGGAPTPKTYV